MEQSTQLHEFLTPQDAVKQSFAKIAPFWPLQNLIAVNPLQGLEDLSIEQAMIEGAAYFQQENMPKPMQAVNRESIKWLQPFFDEGQAPIPMPMRERGLYGSWLNLAKYDVKLHNNKADKQKFIAKLSEEPHQAMGDCLNYLQIEQKDWVLFLTLMLTTMSGWASYIKYLTDWNSDETAPAHPSSQADYLAVRLAITCLLWEDAKQLIQWHQQALTNAATQLSPMEEIQRNEQAYRLPLLNQLSSQDLPAPHTPEAQLVFCIDVRSEPLRRAIEQAGDYATYGYAGFFGIPARIKDEVSGESYASCPVLLKPQHTIVEKAASNCSHATCKKNKDGYGKLNLVKRCYQSIKYNIATPFALVEALGFASGVWMSLRSFAPEFAHVLKAKINSAIRPQVATSPDLSEISFEQQCGYAISALKMIGLTSNFAPIIVLCGHGGATINNAYASALDCGACGGRHGAGNARILAKICNDVKVREHLAQNGILIPQATRFIAAKHNTTTDAIILYEEFESEGLTKLKDALSLARETNSKWRCLEMGVSAQKSGAKNTELRSHDWAQVRPEWGLSRNACFIIAPRALSQKLDLQGRAFLHSYDYIQDENGASLTTILTAPMIVTQWINAQYLFSTLDNVAYGGGSKITKNITGKIGIMQGNASDLMTGLPLQSVYIDDKTRYHEVQRLMSVVYAPSVMIDAIIAQQPILQKLFKGGWVTLACIEPQTKQTYLLQRDLSWQQTKA